MNKRVDGNVVIDGLTINLPAGWQGDPVYLARKISEQIQSQAIDMQSTEQMSLTLQGHYSGTHADKVVEQFARQFSQQVVRNRINRGGR